MLCWVLNAEYGVDCANHYFDPGFSVNLANISRKAKKNTLLHHKRIISTPQSSMFDMV